MESRAGGQAFLGIFPDGFAKDRACKEMWLVNDAAGKITWDRHSCRVWAQPTGTGYSAEKRQKPPKLVLC